MNEHMLAQVPPMGWNSWNTFYEHVNEKLVCETAEAMISQGLYDAGYRYLILDDGWQSRQRGSNGQLEPDKEAFPRGLKPVIDFVHSKGLKFGLYSCCGTRTCAGYPGSFDHEYEDAKQMAEWGVDYLKYDNCFRPNSVPSSVLYRRMSMALRNSGRDIVFAACQWGTEDVHHWIRSSGAHTFRSTIDIQDCWASIENIVRSQLDKQEYGAQGCFNDMDMLVVGMEGGGMNPEASMGGCSNTEYQTHFALWAMMNSPLIIGCDIRKMSDTAKKILTNPDMIALNQDPECRSVQVLTCYGNPDVYVLVKPLCGGDYAVGYFNFSDTESNVQLNLWDMGLTIASGKGMRLYDCISRQDAGVVYDLHMPKIPAHGCAVYRCSLEK